MMHLCSLLCQFTLVICCILTDVLASTRQLSDVVESLLSDAGYKSRIRPGADSGHPLIVSIDININDISSISEVKMEYSLTMFLRQTWIDERLRYSGFNRSITLNYNQFSRLWSPDLFIRNLKSGQFHDITVPNRLIRLSPDGTVLYSQRLSVTLACDMQLEKYPMDNQTCKIEFGSYGYTTDDIVLVWKALDDPVEINPEISLPEFVLMAVHPVTCATNYATTGSFPCLRTFIHLKRRLKFYILQIYLPSLLIVLLSWVSFWIDLDAVPARTSLGILTILTITTQSAGINIGLPAVSFTKAIDVWMATCLVFVFVAFLEYSVVNVLSRKHKKEKKNEEKFKRMTAQLATGIANIGGRRSKMLRAGPDEEAKEAQIRHRMKNGQTPLDPETRRQQSMEGSIWSRAQHNQALMVDVISRVIFPVLFTIFQAIYWPLYFL